MNTKSNIAEDLFYKIRSRFSGLKLGEENGEITVDPKEATFFDFNYKEGEKNIGHISISLAEDGSMKVYFSSGITEGMDKPQQKNWYNFLRELRSFAKRRLLSFDVRDIAKDSLDKRDYEFLTKHALQSQDEPLAEPVEENIMNESTLYGTKTQSFQKLNDTRMIIKHSKKLTDDQALIPNARTRNISSLFIENSQGERFKYPFNHLAGARAMQRHVANGGNPYDDIGSSITQMSEEMKQLKLFQNYVNNNNLVNEANSEIVEKGTEQLNKLREQIKKLSKQKNYETYVENFQGNHSGELPETVRQDLKNKFTVISFKEEMENVFPVLYRLMKENNVIGYNDIVGENNIDVAEGRDVDENTVRQLLNQFDQDANEMNAYGDVNPETVIRHLEQGDVEEAIQTVMDAYAGPDGEEPTGNFESLLAELEDDFASVVNSENDDFDYRQEYDDDPMDDMMDGFERFETWVNNLGEESAIVSRDAEEKQAALRELNNLMGEHFPAGVDGTNAIESLEGIIDDPALFNQIKQVAKEDPNQCVRPVVKDWLEGNAPDVVDEVDFGDMQEEGNKFTGAMVKAKKQGKDEFEVDGEKFKVEEVADFVMSFYDRERGTFPKGPTAVEQQVSKKFGETAGKAASQMIERMAPAQGMDEDSKFDRNFDKRIAAKVKGGAGADYMSKKADELDKQNPDKGKGIGIGVLDTAKARKKAKEKGVRAPGSLRASPNTRDPKRLPEQDKTDDLPFDANGKSTAKDEFGNVIKKKNVAKHLAKKGMRKAMSKDEIKEVADYIMSFYDRESSTFPNGSIAVMQSVEEKFGEIAGSAAEKIIERMAPQYDSEMIENDQEVDESGLQYHIGKKKYGKDGMEKLAKAGRDGASEEELGAIKDKYKKEELDDIARLAGL